CKTYKSRLDLLILETPAFMRGEYVIAYFEIRKLIILLIEILVSPFIVFKVLKFCSSILIEIIIKTYLFLKKI
ncbi:hypothetical protein ACWKSR_09940, partial [Campylobacter fetus subsp. venerealis]